MRSRSFLPGLETLGARIAPSSMLTLSSPILGGATGTLVGSTGNPMITGGTSGTVIGGLTGYTGPATPIGGESDTLFPFNQPNSGSDLYIPEYPR